MGRVFTCVYQPDPDDEDEDPLPIRHMFCDVDHKQSNLSSFEAFTLKRWFCDTTHDEFAKMMETRVDYKHKDLTEVYTDFHDTFRSKLEKAVQASGNKLATRFSEDLGPYRKFVDQRFRTAQGSTGLLAYNRSGEVDTINLFFRATRAPNRQ